MRNIVTKYKRKRYSLLAVASLVFTIVLGTPHTRVNAQALTIKGTISASAAPVRYASITFVDNNNSANKFTALTDSSGDYEIDINITAVKQHDILPNKFELKQNYPNPFSSSTSIPYKLKTESDVYVAIYDILGRKIKEFNISQQSIGTHEIFWDGRNNLGEQVATGIYFYRMQADGVSSVKKMIFDPGEKNGLISAQSFSSQMPLMKEQAEIDLQGDTYTVQIENTDSTYPAINSQQFSNVAVQGDTTLDYSVNELNVGVVYSDSIQQIIRGFGGGNILIFRPDMTTAEVNTAFGNGPGQLGFTILRLSIPSSGNISDFSSDVPTAKLAESLGAIVFATPWSPPASMKTNNSTIGGYLKDSSYDDYAAYLKSYTDYMANNGAPLYAVSIQNEPDANVNYVSCYWSATDFLNFCKNNAGSIGTRIMMPESEDFNHALSDSTLNDSAAAANVSIIGGHLYGGGLEPYPLAKSKGKDLWMTEWLDTDTTWAHNLATGKQINDCMNAGMNAYVWWYMVRFYGPIGEDGHITKRGYVMSQYSKFVRPGYHKIKCDKLPQGNVYVTSYKDSSSSRVVIVVLNENSSSVYQSFSIADGEMVSFTPYTTSSSKNAAKGNNINVRSGGFTAVLEPSSITTFVSN
jgi:glucuronoarabinoxylan endo-1,4-beta-xylanase